MPTIMQLKSRKRAVNCELEQMQEKLDQHQEELTWLSWHLPLNWKVCQLLFLTLFTPVVKGGLPMVKSPHVDAIHPRSKEIILY